MLNLISKIIQPVKTSDLLTQKYVSCLQFYYQSTDFSSKFVVYHVVCNRKLSAYFFGGKITMFTYSLIEKRKLMLHYSKLCEKCIILYTFCATFSHSDP